MFFFKFAVFLGAMMRGTGPKTPSAQVLRWSYWCEFTSSASPTQKLKTAPLPLTTYRKDAAKMFWLLHKLID